jgi:hypothetical protein
MIILVLDLCETESLGTATSNEHLCHFLDMEWAGGAWSTLINLFLLHGHFVHDNPTCITLGVNPDLEGQKLATNRLTYGASYLFISFSVS